KVQTRFDDIDADLKHITDVTEDTLRNTHQIIELNNVMIQKIAQSTSTILQGVFEANEVTTPTCFIILPYKLEKKEDQATGKSRLMRAEESIEKAKEFMSKVNSWSGTISEAMENPSETVGNLVKQKMDSLFSFDNMKKYAEDKIGENKSQYLWFYLVDEYTGEPVDGGKYPIRIQTQSDMVKKCMPMMKMGMTAVKCINGVAGMAKMFGVPTVPQTLVNMANDTIKSMDQESTVAEFGVVQNVLDKALEGKGGKDEKSAGKSDPKRGAELREFKKFLEKHDPGQTYAGLARICQQVPGPNGSTKAVAIWTTNEGKTAIEHEQVAINAQEGKDKEYEEKMKEQEEKIKEYYQGKKGHVSPAKEKRQKIKKDLMFSPQKEVQTPSGKKLKPISPFSTSHGEQLEQLAGLTKTVEELGKYKPHGEQISGTLFVRKVSTQLGGVRITSSSKEVTVKIRGDGILTYENQFVDLTKIEDCVAVGANGFKITGGVGGVSVQFNSRKGEEGKVKEWIEKVKTWDKDLVLSEAFEAKKKETLEKIQSFGSILEEGMDKDTKMLKDLLDESDSDFEEEGETDQGPEAPKLELRADVAEKLSTPVKSSEPDIAMNKTKAAIEDKLLFMG
ncbi:hypothetical protein TrST_g3948, partial [Triparma strigata]